jgi:hypothetical protein
VNAVAIEADGLGKRYGATWAFRDCSEAGPRCGATPETLTAIDPHPL